jgi:uncharacterized membrane protein YhiD involved in acid resistance
MNELWQQLSQLELLLEPLISLPLAAVLGSLLAFRPRRRGTPPRDPSVIHAQIILAIVGALVMIVIGESLARAFGIVGAAGLVRYRAKVRNAKDAGVMLATLGIGLASGVGLYLVAVFATGFFLLVLWLVESHEPRAYKHYHLKVSTREPAALRPLLETALKRQAARYELQSCASDELRYDVQVPLGHTTDEVWEEVAKLHGSQSTEYEWEQRKGRWEEEA